jgi:hypothetical protein
MEGEREEGRIKRKESGILEIVTKQLDFPLK